MSNNSVFIKVTNKDIYEKLIDLGEKVDCVNVKLQGMDGKVNGLGNKVGLLQKVLWAVTGGTFAAFIFVFGKLL